MSRFVLEKTLTFGIATSKSRSRPLEAPTREILLHTTNSKFFLELLSFRFNHSIDLYVELIPERSYWLTSLEK